MGDQVEILLGRARWTARAVARHRRLAFGVALAVALLSAAVITARPERYEARARVYVDTQTVLKPLMAGLTFQPDVDQQVRMLARTLISRPNVERLVSMPELQLLRDGLGDQEKVVTQLMEQIKLDSAAAGGNVYDISFRGISPERAERLVAATLEMFVNAGIGSKKRDSEDAGKFIEGEIQAYENKLVEAENRVKDFKVRNFGVSGVSDRDYFSRVSSLSEGVEKLRTDLASAERSRDAYRKELAFEDPQLPVEAAAKTAGPTPEVESRLAAQKKQLDELLGRYTEDHPDVIATRRVVAQLEAETADHRRSEERAQAGKAKSGTAATSPVYQQLRISLAEAEARVAALRSQLSAQQGQLEQTRALATRAPLVEAELAQLNRDYDVIRKNYDQMVARRESALLGAKLDESTQLAEFRVVEPPRVSPNPVRPARWHLALAAIVLSFAAGIAAAALAEVLRPTIDEARALRQFSGRAIVGTVSMQALPSAARQRKTSSLVFTAAVSVLLLLQIVWVVWMAANSRAG